MKQFVLILCIFVFNASWVHADELAMADTVPELTHRIADGVVKSISSADPAKGTKSEIIIIDKRKQKINILVISTTTLWDSESKAILADKILPRSRVNVIYLTTPEGVNIAKSIKVIG